MGQPKRLDLPESDNTYSGITIEYIKSRDMLLIHGHYDSYCGIAATKISFKDFCDRLGIDLKRR